MALSNLAAALWREGDQEEAIAVQLELRDLLELDGSCIDWLDASWQVAFKYKATGQALRCVQVLDEAIPAAVDLLSLQNIGFLNLLKGYALAELEKYVDAIQCLEIAAHAFEEDENSAMLGDSKAAIASYQAMLGFTEMAIEGYEAAIRLFEREGKAESALETYIQLGELHIETEDHSRGLVWLSQALPLARFLEDANSQQIILRLLGVAHSNLRHGEVAVEFLKSAICMKETLDQKKESAQAMNDLAEHYLRVGELELGRSQKDEVAPILRALGLDDLS